MLRFHHFFNQVEGCFVGVAAMIREVKVLRFVLNQSGMLISVTGEVWKFFRNSVRRDYRVRSQFGEELAERRVGETIKIRIAVWSEPVVGRLFSKSGKKVVV